jgi:hypothetical protein
VNTVTVQCVGCESPACLACRITRAHGVGLIEGDTYYHLPEITPPAVNDCRTCVHYGDEIKGEERKGLKLCHLKIWHRCERGHEPIPICNTQRQCPDYTPREAD